MKLKAILGVALLVSSRGFRAGYAFLSSLLSTLWLLAFAYLIGGITILPHALVGAIIASTLTAGGISAVYDAYYSLIKLRDMFLASPVSPLEFRIGVALGHLLPGLPHLLAYCTILFVVSRAPPVVFLIVVPITVLVVWIMGVLLGYIVAREDLNAGPKINFINQLLTLLPPIYYPTSMLPKELRPLAYLAPTYNVSELIKSLLNIVYLDFTHITICTIFLAIQLTVIVLIGLKIK